MGIEDLCGTMIEALEKLDWRTQQMLFVTDPDPNKHGSDLVQIVTSIVSESLESIANNFKGFDDEVWSHAISIFMDIYPFGENEPAGMSPLQQQLALKLLDKVRQNMEGWYPAITRVLLAVVGPYEAHSQNRSSAFALFRDAFYRELQNLPILHVKKPGKVTDFLPENVIYDVEQNTLTHTYRGGNVILTKLSELELPEIDLCDESVWRKPA